MIVTKGSDQVSISSRFEIRNDPSVVRNYGSLLIEFAKITPDGMVVFSRRIFTWSRLFRCGRVWGFGRVEAQVDFGGDAGCAGDVVGVGDIQKGVFQRKRAVLLSVARGKVSEGIDFDHHYGRTVLMIGIPFQYTESRILKARLEFMRDHFQIKENDFLSFDAMRHAAQCLGRVLRGKDDYGIMVLADRRFARKKNQLPKWIAQALNDSDTNLSTDMALATAKSFA